MAGTIMKDHVIVKSGNRHHRHAAAEPPYEFGPPVVTVCKAHIPVERCNWRYGRFDEITCQNCKDLLSRVSG